MCRVRASDFRDSPAAAGEARAWVRRNLGKWGLAGAAATDAVLLTSELVSNAVLHARGTLAVSLAVAEGTLEIGVSDPDPRPPVPRLPSMPVPGRPGPDIAVAGADLDAREGGRGLLLLDKLADEWGVATLSGGKQVWFRLDAGEDWRARTECPCAGDNLDLVRLESGRHVLAVAGPWDQD